jgi:RNA polymerase sigma factor (sigma-70 family)
MSRRLNPAPPTSRLVELAQIGDVDAFTELVRQHQDRAYATALSMLGDPGRAQDAVQDAFLVAFGNLGKLLAPEAFSAWLRQIVRHQASRILRSQRFDLPLARVMASFDPDPADAAERRDDLKRILRAIDELPEGEREATILFYLKDQSQKTVAGILDLPVTTVNNRLHAARIKLKGELLPLMETILPRQTLPPDFASVVGRLVRVEGAVADGIPRALARLTSKGSGTEPIETGIKVIDLLCPIADGGSIGLFGDARVGKLVLVEELTHNLGGRGRQPAIFTFVKAPQEVDTYTELLAEAGPLPTIVIAADEASEQALMAARPFLDAAVFMARHQIEVGIYPAVDPLRSWSRLLDRAFVGAEHWEVAERVREALQAVHDTGSIGSRARRIRNFLSQPFFSAEAYTKRAGAFVPRQNTISAFRRLLAGTYDRLPEQTFLMRGTVEEVVSD